MLKENVNDLIVFMVIAQEKSFTRAAVKLGVSQSALSHAMRGLEQRMGIRLLTRTTRKVAPTHAGEWLLERVGPHLMDIESELNAMKMMRDKPAGNIRITAVEHAVDFVLWPVLRDFLVTWPDITIDVVVDNALTDVVGGRFDASIRLGEAIAKEMVAIPVSPELRMAVVGSPDYFTRYPPPETVADLQHHRCIITRSRTQGGLMQWDFSQQGKALKVRVEGQLMIEPLRHRIDAARQGLGLAYVPEDSVMEDILAGTLQRVLTSWCEPFPGYYLYYPSRRQLTTAFSLFIDAMHARVLGQYY